MLGLVYVVFVVEPKRRAVITSFFLSIFNAFFITIDYAQIELLYFLVNFWVYSFGIWRQTQ